jgi:hypothetical protein
MPVVKHKNRPDLKRYARSGAMAYGPLVAGGRWRDLAWLGPYTPEWVPDYIRMRMRRDAQIQLASVAVKAPFYGNTYRLEGGRPEVRAACHKEIIDQPWFKRLVGSVMNSLDFGRQGLELVWSIRDIHVDPDGEGPMPSKVLRRAYVFDKPRDLHPERTSILVDTEMGDFAALDFDGNIIPSEKAVLAVHRQEFGDPLGMSLLDGAYNPWFWGNQVYVFWMRHLEIKGDPPLVGTAPPEPNWTPDDDLDDQDPDDPVREMALLMAQLRSSGSVVLPAIFDEKTSQPLYTIREMDLSERGDLFLRAVQHMNDMKMRSWLVPERIVTQDSTLGSFAMQQGMLDVFFSNLQSIQDDLILPTLQAQVVNPFVRANWGRATAIPTLRAGAMSKVNKQLLADIVMRVIDQPRRTPDGREYQGGQIVDLVKSLKDLNVSLLRPEDVAPMTPGMVPDVDGSPPGAEEVADLALNGAQITALQGILVAITDGSMAPEAGAGAIRSGFPSIPSERIDTMVSAAAGKEGGGGLPSKKDPDNPIPPPAEAEVRGHPDKADDIAGLYGVSRHTVNTWASSGCPCIRLQGSPRGGRLRFRRDDVEQWRAAKEAEMTGGATT